jgi:hypothetical protein
VRKAIITIAGVISSSPEVWELIGLIFPLFPFSRSDVFEKGPKAFAAFGPSMG